MIDPARCARVAIQVWASLTNDGRGLTEQQESESMARVTTAAETTFHPGINDLDWEAAAYRHLMRRA